MNEVIYSDLKLQHPSQPQRRQELPKPKRKHLSTFRLEEFPASSWKFIAIILGIICLVLLSSVGLLAAKLNQDSFKAGRFTENKTVSKCSTCSHDWHQHGDNCYLFSRKNHQWMECGNFCAGLKSRFLKVDTEDELNFVIKLSMMHDEIYQKFFISLNYNRKLRKWVWFDGTEVTLDSLKILGQNNIDNKCMQIKYDQISAEDCKSIGSCICKKKIYSDQIKNEKVKKLNI